MPKLRLHWAVPLLLACTAPGALVAQRSTSTLNPGDEVRVYAPAVLSARVQGTVLLYEGGAIEVREAGSGSVVTFPIESIRTLARNEGVDRGRSSWWMARLGGFLGGAAGLASGPLIATSRAPKRFGEIMLVSGVVGFFAGAGVGAALGATFAMDHWQSFRMPIVPVVGVGQGGAQLGFSAALP